MKQVYNFQNEAQNRLKREQLFLGIVIGVGMTFVWLLIITLLGI